VKTEQISKDDVRRQLAKWLYYLDADILTDMVENSELIGVPRNTRLLKEGDFVKIIPFVINGLVKVYTSFEDKELLLYYIRPGESCIMSFAASLRNEQSKIYAVTEEKSVLLLLPTDKVSKWMKQSPDVNRLFFMLFNQRYADLLETIQHLIFNKLDVRLYNYLKDKVEVTKTNPIKISHRQIAAELGTAREVVSRMIKKLEREGKILQMSNSIKIFPVGD